MTPSAILLSITLAHAPAQQDAANFLQGSWLIDAASTRREVLGNRRIVFSEGQVSFAGQPEPVTAARQHGDLILVRTRASTAYLFERLGPDTMCMVAPRAHSVVPPASRWSRTELRPVVRDGLLTVNCYRRAG